MAAGLRDRLRAGAGTMDDWLQDRKADLAHGLTDLEARGHELYGEAIRGGRRVVARTTAEVRELAKETSRLAAKAGRAPATQSPAVRKVVSDVARSAGNVVGVGTGVAHMARDIKDGAVLTARLFNPLDPFVSPKGEAAWDHVADFVGDMIEVGKNALADPRAAAGQVVEKAREMQRELDPLATPEAQTLGGEARRNFDIGQHQGELLVDIVPYAIGGGELKGAIELATRTKAGRIAKHVAEGFSPTDAAYLAEPYKGAGHHSLLPQRAALPQWAGGGPIPRAILDSPFNVLKPAGMSRGEFYELHSGVDPYFWGTGLQRGGGSWSAKRLGISKYELPQRLWYGTPSATKRAIAGVGVTGQVPFGGEEER